MVVADKIGESGCLIHWCCREVEAGDDLHAYAQKSVFRLRGYGHRRAGPGVNLVNLVDALSIRENRRKGYVWMPARTSRIHDITITTPTPVYRRQPFFSACFLFPGLISSSRLAQSMDRRLTGPITKQEMQGNIPAEPRAGSRNWTSIPLVSYTYLPHPWRKSIPPYRRPSFWRVAIHPIPPSPLALALTKAAGAGTQAPSGDLLVSPSLRYDMYLYNIEVPVRSSLHYLVEGSERTSKYDVSRRSDLHRRAP
ncbi:hypothetical protein MGYG_02537 [Nannizzia gypsea CBS 118893]|uniref:Uncharacterized protein n=1 Tax=Arthroderma gypseum (strain ATCC MYA-4604 / CBS 118893) TaxID=535722 RepID=E4UN11_ARTGP|nr:hypothetical protein MGYG_02537 [Nannizzia gypsea CBS 118893]EFQ99525.1 hypothetical protein MGYG_02537 [Nannizzia gypsea CBS 118893]